MRRTSLGVFLAYEIGVTEVGANYGGHIDCTSAFASFRLISAVLGMEARSTASSASRVPGTDASTCALGWSAGIFANSAGSDVDANAHSPCKSAARNQRPEAR